MKVVLSVVAQRVVDLETQLASWGVERGAPHVAEEHLHGDLPVIFTQLYLRMGCRTAHT